LIIVKKIGTANEDNITGSNSGNLSITTIQNFGVLVNQHQFAKIFLSKFSQLNMQREFNPPNSYVAALRTLL